mmetsp:Transcript_124174/g.356744  ORF Transcript_124174/g.356744 Transcript_124174/m.356744 type:complete len:381 (-) Transcript_124174:36-1178(-)
MDLERGSEQKPASMGAAHAVGLVLTGCKYVLSTILTAAAIGFVCYGIGSGEAVLGLPPAANYAILVFVLVLLAYLEGLQVAILALEGQDGEQFKATYPRGHALHSLVMRGANVQRFLVGRQFYVVFVVFLCSQVTTFPDIDRPNWFPDFLWFALVQTGLPGALIVLAFGQLMPQLIASRHPIVFCNLYGSMTVLRITLLLEAIGVTHFSWLLTATVAKACRLGTDDKPTSSLSTASTAAPSEASKSDGVDDTSSEGLLRRLVRIQGAWSRAAQKDGTQHLLDSALLGPAGPQENSGGLFVTAAMAKEGMQGSAFTQQDAAQMDTKTPNADVYPTPTDIVAQLLAEGQQVPRFLLPPEHELHVPPHIVAYSLMSSIAGQRL